tara:strand:+ start:5216 stop:6040 length:825 start_codon:yes stop_codon:yes gene_type:complete
MIDAEFDLLPGAIEYDDRIPANYSTPDGYYIGVGYDWDNKKPEPIYTRAEMRSSHYLPTLYKATNNFTKSVQNFIKSQTPIYLSAQLSNKNVYIGIGHKLSKLEVANHMIAFRSTGIIPLDDLDVQRIIKQYYRNLRPSLGKTTEQVRFNLNTPKEVFDKESSIYVVNFKNGVSDDTIKKLFAIDYYRAVNTIQNLVKAPLSKNQFAALISLAFTVEQKRLRQSKLINKINRREYHKAVSHFIDFSMVENDYTSMVSESLYNTRIREAKLFATL